MVTADGGTALSFNGEIYNHLELRDRPIARGARFESTCDAETLLHSLDLDGVDAVRALDGMFAFAAWRSHSQQEDRRRNQ